MIFFKGTQKYFCPYLEKHKKCIILKYLYFLNFFGIISGVMTKTWLMFPKKEKAQTKWALYHMFFTECCRANNVIVECVFPIVTAAVFISLLYINQLVETLYSITVNHFYLFLIRVLYHCGVMYFELQAYIKSAVKCWCTDGMLGNQRYKSWPVQSNVWIHKAYQTQRKTHGHDTNNTVKQLYSLKKITVYHLICLSNQCNAWL